MCSDNGTTVSRTHGNPNFVKLVLFNARSLVNKLFDLQHMCANTIIPDVVAVTETWLSSSHNDALLQPYIDSYTIYRCDRDSRGGGAAIFVHDSLHSVHLCNVNAVGIESVWCKVSLPLEGSTISYILGCVYRAPTCHIAAFTDWFQSVQHNVYSIFVSAPIIIMGDFNFPTINWSVPNSTCNDVYDNLMLSCISQLGLTQCINMPTRLANTLDLVLTNVSDRLHDVSVLPPFSNSDHELISFMIFTGTNLSTIEHAPSPPRFDYAHADFEAIDAALCLTDWHVLFANCLTIQQAWDAFSCILGRLVEQHVPRFRRPLYLMQSSRRQWLPLTVKRAIAAKATAWRLWRANPCTETRAQYTALAKAAKKSLFNFKRRQEEQVLASRNLKYFFRHVNKKLNPLPKPIKLIKPNGEIVQSDERIGLMFNEFFSSVFTRDDGNLPPPPSHTDAVMPNVVLTSDKIRKKLLSLKVTSSCGPDGIHPSILKHSASALSLPLNILFNLSYASSCLPHQWLTAHVIPLYKHSGSRLLTENYRPISLTSIVCKVFEGILKDEMMTHLMTNNLIRNNQHGFLPKHSTQSNLLETIHDWAIALDKKDNIDSIFIDFKKAFDSISHTKLLHKLNSFGFPALTLNWIKSFLACRTQQVRIGHTGSLSSVLPCTSGVPQGSVLGPILFLIFINDLIDVLTFGKIMLYADDATLYAKVNSVADALRLQFDLDKIAQWSQQWQLPINIKKCMFMRVRVAANFAYTYSINGIGLQHVDCAQMLGVTLCQNLSVSKHCDSVASQGHKRAFLLLNSFRSSNLAVMTSLFKIYVRPILEYCSLAWSPHLLKDIDQIESVQRFFTRNLPGMSQLPYRVRLIKLGLQSLELRRIHSNCIYVYKMLHNNVATHFCDMFTLRSDVTESQMSLRGNSLTINIPRFHIDALEHNFVIRAAHYWNALPNHVVQSASLNVFCNHLHNVDFALFLKGRAITRP